MRKAILLFLVVAIVSIGIGFYMYQMPVKSLANAKPDVSIDANDLMDKYEENEEQANKAYLGKVIEVKGVVVEVETSDDGTAQILLKSNSMMGRISCSLEARDVDASHSIPAVGNTATIKGKCSGYLMDVVLERCIVVDVSDLIE